MKTKVLIIGSGISGLTSAIFLLKNGISDFQILEKNLTTGGCFESLDFKNFSIDFGPNSILIKYPEIQQLLDYLDINHLVIKANKNSKKRFIYKNNHFVKVSPKSLLLTNKILTIKEKLKVLKELFYQIESCPEDISIEKFITQHFGVKVARYLIDPFISGIFAGDIAKISAKVVLADLIEMQESHGSIILAMLKNKKQQTIKKEIISFIGGMERLTNTMHELISNRVHLDCNVTAIKLYNKNSYQITYQQGNKLQKIETEFVINTAPAKASAKFLKYLSNDIVNNLLKINYTPLLVAVIAFEKNKINLTNVEIKNVLNSFGFLIPSCEKKNFLGALINSSIFNYKSPKDKILFTLFIGGARNNKIFDHGLETALNLAKSDFMQMLKIDNVKPLFIKTKFWSEAIPQFEIGHLNIIESIKCFEKEYPKFFMNTNYINCASTSCCIKNSKIVVDKLLNC